MTRLTLPRWLAPAVLTSAITLVFALFAACSSSDAKPSQDKWVADICSAAKAFGQAQDKATAGLDTITDSTSNADQKKIFQQTFADFDKATKAFRADFDKAGTPDIDHGDDITKLFVATFDANQQAVDKARKAIDGVDPNSATFTNDIFDAFGDDPTKGFHDKLTATVGGKPVAEAIAKDADCAKIWFDDDTASPAETPTVAAKGSATAAPSGTARAQTTVKPNAGVNEKWVTGLCLAATGYEADLRELSGNVDLNNTSDTKSIKDRMVRFLQDAQARTRQFKTDIDKLGDPDVKDGKAIESAMSVAAGKVVAVFDQAATDVVALDASDPAKLAQGLETVGESLDTASNDVGDAFDQIDMQYDTTALTKIGQAIPECAGLLD
jgi:hypothetical protein